MRFIPYDVESFNRVQNPTIAGALREMLAVTPLALFVGALRDAPARSKERESYGEYHPA